MAFPETGILDDFDRAEQSPPGGALNDPYNPFGLGNLAIDSSGRLTASTTSWCSGRTSTVYGPNQEIYITVVNPISDFQLHLCDTATGTGTNGYELNRANGNNTWRIFRCDNGSETLLGTSYSGYTPQNGDAFGLSYDASTGTISAWVKPSGGSWSLMFSRTDTTYQSGGKIGVDIAYNTMYLDNLGGGTVSESYTLESVLPDADVTTTGWTTTPLFSKVNDASDSTVIQAVADVDTEPIFPSTSLYPSEVI